MYYNSQTITIHMKNNLPNTNMSVMFEQIADIIAKELPSIKIFPNTIIRPICGSMGSLARIRPSGVSSSFFPRHFISKITEIQKY